MIRYLCRRAVGAAVVLVVMSMVLYALIGLMPGDPIDVMVQADPRLTPADAARLKALYGLDLPVHERYLNWLGAALTGDFGYSRLHHRPVLELLWPRLGVTVELLGLSLVLSLLLAVPAGVLAARRAYSWLDHLVSLLSLGAYSVPAFWLALMLIMAFSVELGWLPASGIGDLAGGGTPAWHHRVLPVLTLSAATVGGFIRFVRAAMMEELRRDYVRTARAKGLRERRVVYRHALKNALVPVITIVGLSLGTLVSGALVTETMFAYPGMGKLIYDAVMASDYNLALVSLLFATLLVLLGNLAADLTYAWMDPRVRIGAGVA